MKNPSSLFEKTTQQPENFCRPRWKPVGAENLMSLQVQSDPNNRHHMKTNQHPAIIGASPTKIPENRF